MSRLRFLDAAFRHVPLLGGAVRAFDRIVADIGRLAAITAVLANVAGQHARSIGELEARYDQLLRAVRGPSVDIEAGVRSREPSLPN